MVKIEELKERAVPEKKLVDQIPSYEQQRLIQESGILNKVKKESNENTFGKKIIISLVTGFIISCLHLFFEQLVHQQYVQDVDATATIKRWPGLAILWGTFVHFSSGSYSEVYLTIAHLASAIFSIKNFAHDYPTYGETLSVAAAISMCAYASYQIDIKPLVFALLVELVVYFVAIRK